MREFAVDRDICMIFSLLNKAFKNPLKTERGLCDNFNTIQKWWNLISKNILSGTWIKMQISIKE